MYCRSCGKQVKPGTAACPHCGREVEALSGGSGFWDLIEGCHAPAPAVVAPDQTPLQPQAGTAVPKQPTPPPQVANPPAQPEQPRRGLQMPLWARLAACAAALLLILLALSLVQNGRMNAQLANLRQQAESREAQLAEAQGQAESREAQLAEAQGQAESREAQLAEVQGQAESQAAQLAKARETVESLERKVEALEAEKQVLSGRLEALLRTAAPTRQPAATVPVVGVKASAAPADIPGNAEENPLYITVEPADLSNGVYNVTDKISIRWACELPDDGDVEYAIWYINRDDEMKSYIISPGSREKILTRKDLPEDGIPRPVIVRASRRDAENESWWRMILVRLKNG